jgi:hypothetical protein
MKKKYNEEYKELKDELEVVFEFFPLKGSNVHKS